jgi:hypothetical protein
MSKRIFGPQIRPQDAAPECCFSRLRRAEWHQHHYIGSKYLDAYAREMAWREDTRPRPNGMLDGLATAAALRRAVSRTWAGTGSGAYKADQDFRNHPQFSVRKLSDV